MLYFLFFYQTIIFLYKGKSVHLTRLPKVQNSIKKSLQIVENGYPVPDTPDNQGNQQEKDGRPEFF